MSTARETALRVLISCRTNGAWADAALQAQLRRDGVSGADAALCSRLAYGVLQNQLLPLLIRVLLLLLLRLQFTKKNLYNI